MPNTQSTQRTPGPLRSPVTAQAGPATLDARGHGSRRADRRSRADDAHAATLELDGLQDGEEQHVESWLHLSLGFETG